MKSYGFIFLILLVGCDTGPQPIHFGKDVCDFCKMTIMDKKFGAELVNSKGKAQKFDSGECMVNFLKADLGYIANQCYIVNYENPGELLDAEKAFYLHGGQVQSPMGGNLAAFASKEIAAKFQQELQGEIRGWEEVKHLDF